MGRTTSQISKNGSCYQICIPAPLVKELQLNLNHGQWSWWVSLNPLGLLMQPQYMPEKFRLLAQEKLLRESAARKHHIKKMIKMHKERLEYLESIKNQKTLTQLQYERIPIQIEQRKIFGGFPLKPF